MPTRYYPLKASARQVTREDVPGAEVWLYEWDGRFAAYGWRSPKQINHDFHHYYTTEQRRQDAIDRWFAACQRVADEKGKRKAQKIENSQRPNPLNVGDILSGSWGYDQTNVEFWQVVEVKPRSVVIREIEHETVNDHGASEGMHPMSSRVVARRNKFNERSAPETKIVQFYSDGQPYLSSDHYSLTLWDGKPEYSSWYA